MPKTSKGDPSTLAPVNTPASLSEQSKASPATSPLAPSEKPPKSTPKALTPSVVSVSKMGNEILKKWQFAKDLGNDLFRYDAKYGGYIKDAEDVIREFARERFGTSAYAIGYTRTRVEDVIDYVRVAAKKLWDNPKMVKINLTNGLYNTITKELEPHSPDHLTPVRIPIKYDPSAKCPHWLEYTKQVFPQDCLHIPAQLLAWLIMPNMRLQKCMLFFGPGSNGKGVLFHCMHHALGGDDNITTMSLQYLECNRFGSADLYGKLANLCGDLPRETLKESFLFKSVSGMDTITAENKGVRQFKFQPFCRLVFAANELPKSEDTSHGWFRRWIVVPMPNTFPVNPVVDLTLKHSLTQDGELSGLLNMALAHLPTVLTKGITETDSMLDMLIELKKQNNNLPPIERWLSERFYEDMSGKFLAKSQVLEYWLEDFPGTSIDENNLTRLLKRETNGRLVDSVRKIGGESIRVWVGLQARISTVGVTLQ